MVSFQCEACGDVLTKKKLDPHRNQCRTAVYTCIDCMTTFRGTDYRSHTSCMTEDQKYQGALYREKPSKAAKRKSVSIVEPTTNNEKAIVPRKAYVEDVADIDAPPHVPTPPPAVPATSNRDSVFDYMVDESLSGTPQITYSKGKEEMSMKNSAPSIFTNSRPSSQNGHRDSEEYKHSKEYEEQGFTWGAEPVKPRGLLDMNGSSLSLEFMTPAAKEARSKLDKKERPRSHSRTNSGSEKKRKRDDQVQEVGGDTLMADSKAEMTPGLVHSGLTGGISRMMSQDETYPFRRSAEPDSRRPVADKDRASRRSHQPEDPTSPLKRTRHTKDDPNGLGISIKGRAVKALSMMGGALLPGTQGDSQMSNGRTRRRASSSDHGQSQVRVREGEKRERKKHKVHRHNGTASGNIRHEHRSRRRTHSDDSPSRSQGEETRRKLKAIEYRKDDSGSDSESDQNHLNGGATGRRRGSNAAMVVFGAEEKTRRACRSFLANAPGLDSDKGYSIHKMLKRWHKHNDVRSGTIKAEEEQDLWRSLRLRRNERGEYIVFF